MSVATHRPRAHVVLSIFARVAACAWAVSCPGPNAPHAASVPAASLVPSLAALPNAEAAIPEAAPPHVEVIASEDDAVPTLRLDGFPAISADRATLVAPLASERDGERMTKDTGIRWFPLTVDREAEDTWILTRDEERASWSSSSAMRLRPDLLARAETRAAAINARLAKTTWTRLRSAEVERDAATLVATAELLVPEPVPVDSADGIPKLVRWATLRFKEPELTVRSALGDVLFQTRMKSWSGFARARAWARPNGAACSPIPVPTEVWFDDVSAVLLVKIVAGGLGPDGCGGDTLIDLVRLATVP